MQSSGKIQLPMLTVTVSSPETPSTVTPDGAPTTTAEQQPTTTASSQKSGHHENARVLMATKTGSLTDVRSVLTATNSPYQKMTMLDYADERGRTALHYAAESGKVRIVLLLLEQDASGINKQDNEGNTPAHLAMIQGKEGMVVWLAKKGADLSKRKNANGKTVYDLATPKVIELLQQYESSLLIAHNPYGVSFKTKSLRAEHGELLEFCHENNLERVRALLENPATSLRRLIDERGLEGKNPLHIAVENGNLELVNYLLSLGADPNREEEYMNVPLTIAVTGYKDSPEIVRSLIKHKAIVNTKSMFGLVPLILAAENNLLEVVKLLVEAGALVNSQDNAGNTSLHLASQEGHLEVVQYLIEKGANLNIKNENGQLPIEVAVPNVKRYLCELTGQPYVEEEVVTSVVEKSKKTSDLTISPEQMFQWSDVELGSEVGAGAYGKVFYGVWKIKGESKEVAIKKMTNTNPSSLRMMKSEIHAMRNTHHPNVVTFYAACITDQEYSIMSEWMNKGGLKDIVHKARTSLTVDQISKYALDIAKGMVYLHESRRLVHRDLRVDNILLHEVDGAQMAKIADFGLACDASLLNKKGQMKVGSLRWMAPEVFLAGDRLLTVKIDVYSYSMLLWEMMTNEVPFPGETPLQVAQLAAEQERRPPIPEGFADTPIVELMQKCWSHNVDDRLSFRDVVAFLESKKN